MKQVSPNASPVFHHGKTHNEIAKAVNFVNDNALRLGGVVDDGFAVLSVVEVLNDSAVDFESFSVVGFGDPIIKPNDNFPQFQSKRSFKIEEYDEDTHDRGNSGILLRPCAAGRFSEVAVVGIVSVRLRVKTEHITDWNGLASVDVDTDAANLVSDTEGTYRVVWPTSFTAGDDAEEFVWVRVLLPSFSSSGRGGVAKTSSVVDAQVGDVAGTGTMTTQKLDETGTWITRDTGVPVYHMGTDAIGDGQWIQFKTDEDGKHIVDVVLCPETPAATPVGGDNYVSFGHVAFGEFDGTNDYIDCTGADNLTGDWTLSAWVRTDTSTPSIQHPIGTTSTTGIYVEDSGATDSWGFYDGSTKLAASSNLANDGTWYHLAVVKTGTSYELFQDGVSKGSASLADVDVTALVIGARTTAKADIFTGGVGGVQLQDAAASDSDIEKLWRGYSGLSGTVHRYELALGAGTTAIDSGTGLDNGTIATTHPFLSYVVDFDGIDDYFNFGSVGNLTDGFTLAAWVKAADDGNDQRIFSNRGTSMGYDWIIDASSDELSLYDGTTHHRSGASSFVRGVWSHVAVVIDGSSSQFYIDGVAAGSTFNPAINSSTVDLWLGRWSSSYFKGQMADACIYDSALSASEIADMHDDHTYPFGPAYLFCPLNEGTGSTANDTSGNGRNGTGSGSPSWQKSFWQVIGWDTSDADDITLDWIPSGTEAAVLFLDSSDPDADYSATFTCSDLTNGSFGLVGRLDRYDGTHVLLEVRESGTDAEVGLFTFDGSAYTQYGSWVGVPYSDATAYPLALVCVGPAVYGYFGGSQVIDETVSFNVTKTNGGVRCESTDTSIASIQADI